MSTNSHHRICVRAPSGRTSKSPHVTIGVAHSGLTWAHVERMMSSPAFLALYYGVLGLAIEPTAAAYVKRESTLRWGVALVVLAGVLIVLFMCTLYVRLISMPYLVVLAGVLPSCCIRIRQRMHTYLTT